MTEEKKRPEMSKTFKSLKLTRNPLSKTLLNMKDEQESLQTSLRATSDLTSTGKFRLNQLQRYGKGSLAYSSLQGGMCYFMHPDYGYIAYVPLSDSYSSVCVLADPICSDDHLRPLLNEFLKERNDPVFLHVCRATAQVLSELNFCVNELGVETFIDVQLFNLTGGKKQALRAARNNALRDNIKVREIISVDDSLFKAFKKISDEWLKAKVVSDSDMQFIVRPIVYVDEIDVRRFVAVRNDEIVGFVIFDPMYENGEVTGYLANHLRSAIQRSYSVVDYIILEALAIFKAEGKREISLGLSPMAQVDDSDEFKHSSLLKAHFKYAFERGNYLYNFKNLYQHKIKYRPELPGAREQKVYCAMHTRFLLNRVYSVYKVLGLDPVKQTMTHMQTVAKDWLLARFGKQKNVSTALTVAAKVQISKSEATSEEAAADAAAKPSHKSS